VSHLINQHLASAATLDEWAIASITPAFQSLARSHVISVGQIDHEEESRKSRKVHDCWLIFCLLHSGRFQMDLVSTWDMFLRPSTQKIILNPCLVHLELEKKDSILRCPSYYSNAVACIIIVRSQVVQSSNIVFGATNRHSSFCRYQISFCTASSWQLQIYVWWCMWWYLSNILNS
jgi:hypothetical protein